MPDNLTCQRDEPCPLMNQHAIFIQNKVTWWFMYMFFSEKIIQSQKYYHIH